MFLLVLSCFFRRRKQIASPFIPCLPCSDKIFAHSIFATSTKVRHLLNKIKMLSLCLHFGLCLWQIPADASSPFLSQAFGASRENEPSPSVSHYGKTKYGDKIAPCGRKKIACSKLSGRQYYS